MTSSPKHTTKTNNELHQNRQNDNKNIRILNINFQSLRKKGNLHEALIESSKPDIILGTETWLNSSIKSSEILPPYLNYDIERRDRPSDPHGGVLIAARNELLLSNITRSKNLELISGTITIEGEKKMKIAAYYRPPKQVSDIDNKLFKEEVNGLGIKRKQDILIIGGDFNLPDICWSEQSIQTNQYPTHTNQAYLDTIADNGLEQLVDFPTRKENTLDLFFTTHPSFKQRCKPLPSIGNSDHDIVLLDVACKPVKPKPTRRKNFLWKKAEVNNIQKDIAEFGSTFKNETHQQYRKYVAVI